MKDTTGAIDPTYHRWLLSAFNKRIAGDYGVEASFTKAEVREMVEQATEFLQTARRYLESPQ